MDESETQKSFIRQRRNLIGISLILFFYYIFHIKIDAVNIIGNHIEIGNPSHVVYALWIVWLYFLLRYYQYYRETARGVFHTPIRGRMMHHLPKSVRRKFKKTYDPNALPVPLPHKFEL